MNKPEYTYMCHDKLASARGTNSNQLLLAYNEVVGMLIMDMHKHIITCEFALSLADTAYLEYSNYLNELIQTKGL